MALPKFSLAAQKIGVAQNLGGLQPPSPPRPVRLWVRGPEANITADTCSTPKNNYVRFSSSPCSRLATMGDLTYSLHMSPFSSAPLGSNFESIVFIIPSNCAGISQTSIYSPLMQTKNQLAQRRLGRIQRSDWVRVSEFPPSFEIIILPALHKGKPPSAASFPTCTFNKPKGKEGTWNKKCK